MKNDWENIFENTYEKVFIGIGVFGIVFFVFFTVSNGLKRKRSCSQAIFLKGELSRDIHYYIQNGNISKVYYCDGTSEDIPTSRIIKVVEK